MKSLMPEGIFLKWKVTKAFRSKYYKNLNDKEFIDIVKTNGIWRNGSVEINSYTHTEDVLRKKAELKRKLEKNDPGEGEKFFPAISKLMGCSQIEAMGAIKKKPPKEILKLLKEHFDKGGSITGLPAAYRGIIFSNFEEFI